MCFAHFVRACPISHIENNITIFGDNLYIKTPNFCMWYFIIEICGTAPNKMRALHAFFRGVPFSLLPKSAPVRTLFYNRAVVFLKHAPHQGNTMFQPVLCRIHISHRSANQFHRSNTHRCGSGLIAPAETSL